MTLQLWYEATTFSLAARQKRLGNKLFAQFGYYPGGKKKEEVNPNWLLETSVIMFAINEFIFDLLESLSLKKRRSKETISTNN